MNFVIDSTLWLAKILSGDKTVQIFSVQKALFNFLGFTWWKGGANIPIPKIIKDIYGRVFPILLIWSAILTIKASVNISSDKELLFIRKVNGFIISMTFLASAFKIMYMRLVREKLIETCESLGELEIENSPAEIALRSCVAYGLLLLSNAGTWAAWYMIKYLNVPFDTDYPWESSTAIGLCLTFSCDLGLGVYCALGHVLADTIFPMSVSVINCYTNRMNAKLSKLGSSGKWLDSSIMVYSIDLHAKLINLTDKINDCYRQLFIVQSVYTVIHACILIFAAVKVTDKLEAGMSSLPMLASAYSQLYMYCSYGQSLTTEFDKLTFASYNNKWYNCNIETRKTLVLFTEACKKPAILKGFGQIKATLANFLHSLQESVSYFLVLKTLTSQQ